MGWPHRDRGAGGFRPVAEPLSLARPAGRAVRWLVRASRWGLGQRAAEEVVRILSDPRHGPALAEALEAADLEAWSWRSIVGGAALSGGGGPGRQSWSARLRAASLGCLARNILVLNARDELEEEARRRGVRMVRQKGIALLGVVYGDIGARRLVDMDFYVPPQDLEGAVRLARDLGYELGPSAPWPSGRRHEYVFVRREPDGIALELHPEEGAWWWQRRLGPETILSLVREDGPGLQPVPELLLVQLCLHLLRSEIHTARLKNVVDLGLVLERAAVDWHKVRAILDAVGLWPAVANLLVLLDKLFWTKPDALPLGSAATRAGRFLTALADLRPQWPLVWFGPGMRERRAAGALIQTLLVSDPGFAVRGAARLAAFFATGR